MAGLVLVGATAMVGVLAGRIAPGNPRTGYLPSLHPPSLRYPMGTDRKGSDLLAQVVHGIATTMTVALSVVVISTVVGAVLGTLAGYRGGLVERVIMGVTELFQSAPRFLLAVVVFALFGAGLEKLILLLGLTSWTMLARVVRAETLSVKSREYVAASRSLGASTFRILLRHVVPNVAPPVVVMVALLASRIILIEAGLAFLGFGDPNRVSLGYLIVEAQPDLQVAWWTSVFPGVVLVLIVLGFNLLGEGLNEVLRPTATVAGKRGILRRPGPSASGGERGIRPVVEFDLTGGGS